jgi:hypothetical protein
MVDLHDGQTSDQSSTWGTMPAPAGRDIFATLGRGCFCGLGGLLLFQIEIPELKKRWLLTVRQVTTLHK